MGNIEIEMEISPWKAWQNFYWMKDITKKYNQKDFEMSEKENFIKKKTTQKGMSEKEDD